MKDRNAQILAYLEVLSGSMTGHFFPLNGDNVIGRDENHIQLSEAQINLTDTRVSRQHAHVFYQEQQFYLQDLGSTNGTFLNAVRLQSQTACILREGSRVQVGAVHMRFKLAVAQRQQTKHQETKASPWESEIGLNEEGLDFSAISVPDSGCETDQHSKNKDTGI